MKLDHGALEEALEIWGLDVSRSRELVIVALCGALPVSPDTRWRKQVAFRRTRLDYRHMRCSIGLWHRPKKQLMFFPASTVPFADQVAKAAERGGKGVNQMEPGLYHDFIKGEHLQGKPKGHQALRQTASRLIRRSTHGVPFTNEDRLYYSNPYDNLHCGWTLHPEKPGYSSAGCLVLPGWPHSPRLRDGRLNRGFWKVFHDAVYGVGQKKFSCVLWRAEDLKNSLEALLDVKHLKREPTATGASRDSWLMFGSRGEAVVALQKYLKAEGVYRGRLSGSLDAPTYKAWNAAGFKPTGSLRFPRRFL